MCTIMFLSSFFPTIAKKLSFPTRKCEGFCPHPPSCSMSENSTETLILMEILWPCCCEQSVTLLISWDTYPSNASWMMPDLDAVECLQSCHTQPNFIYCIQRKGTLKLAWIRHQRCIKATFQSLSNRGENAFKCRQRIGLILKQLVKWKVPGTWGRKRGEFCWREGGTAPTVWPEPLMCVFLSIR